MLSDQVYTLHRYTTGKCRVVGVTLKLTGEGEPYHVYNYLTAAAKAGTQVVIRINPSPGNFVDYADPGALPHTLLSNEEPAGGDYCGNANQHYHYRDVRDIAEEMHAIYQVNIQHGWPAASFFFEPANEPNQEWYNIYKQQNIIVDPSVDHKDAWIQMDEYFAALYDEAKELNSALQVLSPPLSQELYGEHYRLGTCNPWRVQGDSQNRSGIDFMKQTFGYDPDAAEPYPEPKADGFAWHNYWRAGYETWQDIPGMVPTMDVLCPTNPLTHSLHSNHFIQYLSAGMQVQIGPRPTFITEADLKSPCQLGEAGTAEGKDSSPEAIRDSLLAFIEEERIAQSVIVWLLINQEADEADTCRVNQDPEEAMYHNYEQNWHEAYGEDANRVYERAWFPLWWQAAW